jgi:hypothetical protein
MCFTLALAYAVVTLQFGASLTDDASSVKYNSYMFIIEATGELLTKKKSFVTSRPAEG